jgi:hypothetical protein
MALEKEARNWGPEKSLLSKLTGVIFIKIFHYPYGGKRQREEK